MNWSKILIGHGFSDLLDSTSSQFPESNCPSIEQIPGTPALEAHAQNPGFEGLTPVTLSGTAGLLTRAGTPVPALVCGRGPAISTVMHVRVLLERTPQIAQDVYDLMILDLHRE